MGFRGSRVRIPPSRLGPRPKRRGPCRDGAFAAAARLWLAALPVKSRRPDYLRSTDHQVLLGVCRKALIGILMHGSGRSVEPRLSARLHLRIEHARQNPPASLDLDPDAVAASLGERVR